MQSQWLALSGMIQAQNRAVDCTSIESFFLILLNKLNMNLPEVLFSPSLTINCYIHCCMNNCGDPYNPRRISILFHDVQVTIKMEVASTACG